MRVRLLRKIRKRFRWEFKKPFAYAIPIGTLDEESQLKRDIAECDWFMEPEISVADHLRHSVHDFMSIAEFIEVAAYYITDNAILAFKWREKKAKRKANKAYNKFMS